MHISAEGKLGIALGLAGLGGAGVLVVAPTPWVTACGWAMIAIAAVGGIALIHHHLCETLGLSRQTGHGREMTALAGMLIFGMGFVVCGVWYILLPSSNASAQINDASRQVSARGIIFAFDYAPDVRILGIKWRKGFSHSELLFRNAAGENILDFDVIIRPEIPIIKSAVDAPFAACRLGPPAMMGPITVISQNGVAESVATPQEDSDENDLIVDSHRLYCDKLAPNTDVRVVLATAVPDFNGKHGIFKEERHDPSFVDLLISYRIGDKKYSDRRRLALEAVKKPN